MVDVLGSLGQGFNDVRDIWFMGDTTSGVFDERIEYFYIMFNGIKYSCHFPCSINFDTEKVITSNSNEGLPCDINWIHKTVRKSFTVTTLDGHWRVMAIPPITGLPSGQFAGGLGSVVTGVTSSISTLFGTRPLETDGYPTKPPGLFDIKSANRPYIKAFGTALECQTEPLVVGDKDGYLLAHSHKFEDQSSIPPTNQENGVWALFLRMSETPTNFQSTLLTMQFKWELNLSPAKILFPKESDLS